jgi:hypothetical protein
MKASARLRNRLYKCDIAELIITYHDGATASSHGLSLTSVERPLHIANVRRASPTRRATKATPAATHP